MAKRGKKRATRTRRKGRAAAAANREPVTSLRFNQFYIGSQTIADCIARGTESPWTHPTLDQAVQDAKDKLEDDRDLELMTIVKIVRVIRRKPIEQPIIVEVVR